jgi:peptidylprolyl isomerase domain and WD repeat-containing protein 1
MIPASSEQHSGTIRLYDGRGDGKPLETVETLHRFPVHIMTVRFFAPKDAICI